MVVFLGYFRRDVCFRLAFIRFFIPGLRDGKAF
jgi:hypothetical protein